MGGDSTGMEGAAAGYIALDVTRGAVLTPTGAKGARGGLIKVYFSPGFSRRCTRRSDSRVTKICHRRDRRIDPKARNPEPTERHHALTFSGFHGFNFHTARFIAAAKVTQRK